MFFELAKDKSLLNVLSKVDLDDNTSMLVKERASASLIKASLIENMNPQNMIAYRKYITIAKQEEDEAGSARASEEEDYTAPVDSADEQAQIDATVYDATKNYGIEKYGIDLDQYGANTRALNAITTTAAVAPSASFMTVRPIEQAAPSRPSALGPILGGFSTAIGTATAIGGEGYIGERFGWS